MGAEGLVPTVSFALFCFVSAAGAGSAAWCRRGKEAVQDLLRRIKLKLRRVRRPHRHRRRHFRRRRRHIRAGLSYLLTFPLCCCG
jgi:hypothetical protein